MKCNINVNVKEGSKEGLSSCASKHFVGKTL